MQRSRQEMPRQQRQPPHREQAHLMPRESLPARKSSTLRKRSASKEEAERQQKWTEEQKNRWSNEINDELDKIAKQSENEQKAYESKLDRLRKEFDSKPRLENAAYAKKLADYAAYAEAMGLSGRRSGRKEKNLTQSTRKSFLTSGRSRRQRRKVGKVEASATSSILNSIYIDHREAITQNAARCPDHWRSGCGHQCLPSGIRDLKDPHLPWWMRVSAKPWRTGRDGICRFNSKRRIWRRRRSNRLFVWNRHLRPHPRHPATAPAGHRLPHRAPGPSRLGR